MTRDKFGREYKRKKAAEWRARQNIPNRNQQKHKFGVDFVKKSTLIHGDLYDYSDVEYDTCMTKVVIKCGIHGIFEQTPNAHLRGQGCPLCAQEARNGNRKRKTTSEFIKQAKDVHGDLYDYSLVEYTNTTSKVSIQCALHGLFKQTPKAHLRGQGCPDCANIKRLTFFESKGEKRIEELVNQKDVEYEKQKTFNDCRFNGYLMRYDFFIPEFNLLIEYDGEQHYKFTPRFHKNLSTFERMKQRDAFKTEYAKREGYKLERILWNENIDKRFLEILQID